MTKKIEVYKCNMCGNIVEVLHTGGGTLVCCGQDMELQTEKSQDQGQEKHVPVLEFADGNVVVKVGSVEHPMEEAHHIEWIELVTPIGVLREFLKPGQPPVATFKNVTVVTMAREYCSLHGLWTGK